jgi:spermidine synthase
MMLRILSILTIFFSAFLLFQVQPMLTKELLPLFGGGASVWTASLCFYQVTLLLGYSYTHLLSRNNIKKQGIIHVSLLLLACLVTFNQGLLPNSIGLAHALQVIVNLTLQVGLMFMLLSATCVLLQRWFSEISKQAVPFHWYAWSNVGSLLALLSYPFLVETLFTLPEQKQIWLVGASVLLFLMTTLVFMLFKQPCLAQKSVAIKQPFRISLNNRKGLWLALSATSSMCLVSTTQMISTNIPPMPLIWVMPLALYLMTFIVAFALPAKAMNFNWLAALIFSTSTGFLMYFLGSQFNTFAQLIMYGLVLAVCCFFCHSYLRLLAPRKELITAFYLCIACGGAIGSILSSLIAPLVFNQIIEYPLSLLTCLGLFVASFLNHGKGKLQTYLSAAGLAASLAIFMVLNSAFNQFNIAVERNFYGYIAVKDVHLPAMSERRLIDGTTIHGTQALDGNNSKSKDYYHSTSGITTTLSALKQFEPLNLGVIGLGAGVIAQLGDEDDRIRFYELNPAVYHMANTHFSYLKNSKANVDVVIADGRIALLNEQRSKHPQKNALVIDAFSSDVIPTHLLTLEAFELYWQRLQQHGVLIVHISSSHIDLMPVLSAHAHTLSKSLALFEYRGNEVSSLSSKWVVMTSNRALLNALPDYTHYPINDINHDIFAKWTDDKSSMLGLLKL